MSKDKAWLVKEVDRLRLENTLSNNPMMISNRDVIAKVSRLIDQLDEPEITEEQAWNKEIDRLSDYLLRNFEKEIGGDRDYETPVDAAIRLLGEKGKPIIPQFVADWYEENLSGGYTDNRNKFSGNDIFRVIQDVLNTNEGLETWGDYGIDEEIAAWAGENEEDFIHLIVNCSYKDGYEVEKEKLYTIELPQTDGVFARYTGDEFKEWEIMDEHVIIGNSDWKYKFTEEEIKAIDERYWAFAEEVTE